MRTHCWAPQLHSTQVPRKGVTIRTVSVGVFQCYMGDIHVPCMQHHTGRPLCDIHTDGDCAIYRKWLLQFTQTQLWHPPGVLHILKDSKVWSFLATRGVPGQSAFPPTISPECLHLTAPHFTNDRFLYTSCASPLQCMVIHSMNANVTSHGRLHREILSTCRVV